MSETWLVTERGNVGKECNPLQRSRVFGGGALEPAESFFFLAERNINCRDRLGRDVSGLSFLHELIENFPRLDWLTHARVSNGEAATRKPPLLLSFPFER